MSMRGPIKLLRLCTRGYISAKIRKLHSYPVNVYASEFKDDVVKLIDQTDEFGKCGNWSQLIEILSLFPSFIDSTLPQKVDQPPLLFTPLHYAAYGGAPINTFEQLIELGSVKCFKTATGETAYDIAKTKGHTSDILQLIEIPMEIQQNSNEIDTMEQALHKLILGRVKNLIKENGQVLPQLAFLYEKGEFHYPVPKMYGGFNVSKYGNGIQVYSFIRIMDGSDETHVIDRLGNISLIKSE